MRIVSLLCVIYEEPNFLLRILVLSKRKSDKMLYGIFHRNIALIYLCYFLKQNINSTYKISSIEFFGRKLYTHLSV